MYTVISVIASLPVLPLDRHIPPRSFDDTSPSAPLLMTGPAGNFLQFSPKAPPRETTVQTVQKKCRSRTGGEGAIPLPPRLFFCKRGSPPPTHVPGQVGNPPSPTSARTCEPPHSGKMPEDPVPRRRFHAKRRPGSCRKSAVCGPGGEGGDPPTPPPLFF